MPRATATTRKACGSSSIGAIGIVFGDIGTSPLYAFRETFAGHHPLALDQLHIIGVAQPDLLVDDDRRDVQICLDHHARRQQGRGRQPGAARADQRATPAGRRWSAAIVLLGVFATALFYGDCMITPAMSVLSAVEGLAVVEPGVRRRSCCRSRSAILIGLFSIQARGTAQGRRVLRADHAGLFRDARGARRDQHRRRRPRSCGRSIRRYAVAVLRRSIRCAGLPRARLGRAGGDRAPRRSMPTWAISGASRSACRGCASCCRR